MTRNTYINWLDYPEILEFIFNSRDKGHTFKEISKMVSDGFPVTVTGNQVQKVYLRYAPDSELENFNSGRQLVQKRNAQFNSTLNAKTARQALDLVISQDEALAQIKKAISGMPDRPKNLRKREAGTRSQKVTIELLFSDWQIGKICDNYNSEIAIKRLQEYTKSVIAEIEQLEKVGYKVEKVVLALLGDIIESMEKAVKKGSARSVDSTTPEQISNAIKHMFIDLIEPLSNLNIPLDVLCVAGNHDHIDNGMINFNPGKEHISWVIYKSLELLTQQSGYKLTRFKIPKGLFVTYDYYGCQALYEHGYGISCTEQSLNQRRNQRIRQLERYIHYFRMGDKHNINRFNDDSLVVNGAFFETDKTGSEYSSIKGYDNQASQLMFVHTPRKDSRLSIYRSFSIQLNHIS